MKTPSTAVESGRQPVTRSADLVHCGFATSVRRMPDSGRSSMATTRPAPRRLRTGGPVTRQRRPPEGALRAGTAAPDFKQHSTPDQTVHLSDFRDRQVILAFYPADWSPVCGDELALFKELLPEFGKHGAQLMGISVGRVWCHAAYGRDRKLHFPLLADFEPRGAVS